MDNEQSLIHETYVLSTEGVLMKSQIAGICAELNEKIDELDKKLEDRIRESDRLMEEVGDVRIKIHQLRTTVSTLQDFAAGEL